MFPRGDRCRSGPSTSRPHLATHGGCCQGRRSRAPRADVVPARSRRTRSTGSTDRLRHPTRRYRRLSSIPAATSGRRPSCDTRLVRDLDRTPCPEPPRRRCRRSQGARPSSRSAPPASRRASTSCRRRWTCRCRCRRQRCREYSLHQIRRRRRSGSRAPRQSIRSRRWAGRRRRTSMTFPHRSISTRRPTRSPRSRRLDRLRSLRREKRGHLLPARSSGTSGP